MPRTVTLPALRPVAASPAPSVTAARGDPPVTLDVAGGDQADAAAVAAGLAAGVDGAGCSRPAAFSVTETLPAAPLKVPPVAVPARVSAPVVTLPADAVGDRDRAGVAAGRVGRLRRAAAGADGAGGDAAGRGDADRPAGAARLVAQRGRAGAAFALSAPVVTLTPASVTLPAALPASWRWRRRPSWRGRR